MRRARPGSRWAHEHTSAALLRRIVDDYGLLGGVFGRYGLTSDDVYHVQELIFGAVGEAPDGWEWRGRGGPSKAFLYEIVANHRNGIDVDKFDYFARDCYHLNIPISFDCERLIMHARAIRDRDGVSTIAYAEKEVWNVYELFRTRFNLHKRAYQHRVVHAVERMLCDALLLAEPFLRLPGTGGARVPLSRAMEDLTAYTGLTDSVFDVIAYAAADDDRSEPGAGKSGGAPRPSREKRSPRVLAYRLEPAAALVRRAKSRKLYAHVGEIVVPKRAEADVAARDEEDLLRDIVARAPPALRERLEASAYVDKFPIHYGMKHANPVDSVLFYLRADDDVGSTLSKERVSTFVPEFFLEYYLRLYAKTDDPELLDGANRAFQAWEKATFGREESGIAPSPTKRPPRPRPRTARPPPTPFSLEGGEGKKSGP